MTTVTTIPIGRLFKVEALSVIIAVVVVTDDDMTLHMTLQPCPQTFLDWWFHPDVWRVDDGLGTPYRLMEAGSRGGCDGEACQASMTWTPSPPSAVERVTFEARRGDNVVLSQWANIEYYRSRAR